MESKKIKKLFNLIALSFITVSVGVCGCKSAPLKESFDEPETREELALPELPSEEIETPHEPELSAPVIPQAPSDSSSTRAEVAAELEFTPISETECSVYCTNILEVTYAEIPATAIIDGKKYAVTEIAEYAFNRIQNDVYYNTQLKTVILPATVKKIGDYAFEICGNLTEINLEQIEEIGSSAFAQDYSLTNLYLASIKSIGRYAFEMCRNIETVYMPKVTGIAACPFRSCEKMSEIVIPKSVVTMGMYVFQSNNTQVKVARGADTSNWNSAWNEGNENQNVLYDYVNLDMLEFTPLNETECSVKCKTVYKPTMIDAYIPETVEIDGKEYTVTEIADLGFSNCRYLESIQLPDSIKIIDKNAFTNCPVLTGINLNGVTEIGKQAFANCLAFTEVIIPESVQTIDYEAFRGCNAQIKAVAQKAPEGWHEAWNSGNNNQNVIWGWFEGKAVFEYTAISETECSVTCVNKDEVTYAEVPLKAIIDGKEYTVTDTSYAFYHCEKLESVSLPYSVTKIGDYTFSHCINLREISTVNVSEIGNRAFEYCTLVDGLLVSGVTKIGDFAFTHCENLAEVEINYAEEVGRGAFYNCENLVSVELNYVSKIGVAAFYNCTSLSEVNLIGTTEIGAGAFYGNTALKSIVIPATVVETGNHVFADCDTQILAVAQSIPYGWNSNWNNDNANQNVIWGWVEGKAILGYSAVSETECEVYCVNKEEATFAEIPETAIIYGKEYTVTDIDGFAGCENLKYVHLPDTVRSIMHYAFAQCINLAEINLNNVKAIYNGAFFNCKALTEIIIPDTVEKIQDQTFNECNTQIKAVAHEKPEDWDDDWNNLNENQNVIWGWFEGKAVYGYTAIEGTDNCAVYCINKDEVTYAEIPLIAIIDGKEYTVTQIAEGGFEDCKNLTTVILSGSITNIGNNAFANCSSLTDILIPLNVAVIGENVFNGCTARIYVIAESKPAGWADNWNGNDTNVIWGWKDNIARFTYRVISQTECEISLINKLTVTEAYIPATAIIGGKEYQVTQIAEGGFKGSTNLKKVVVPYTLKHIGAYAFANCPELESFSIFNTETIGESAFANCSGLERLFIPKSVKFVGKNILSGNNTAVYVRASSDEGWAQGWNAGNAGEVEFDSKLILPVEIPEEDKAEQ